MIWALSALVMAVGPMSDREESFDGITKVRYVELDQSGEATLKLRDGTHQVEVILTIAQEPRGWGEGFVVGPGREGTDVAPRFITDADIWVDGCRIHQPVPPLGGISMPRSAALSAGKDGWELKIFGGDSSESYGLTYAFDGQRILSRELGWGPDYSETTRYDIQVDPEVSPRECR